MDVWIICIVKVWDARMVESRRELKHISTPSGFQHILRALCELDLEGDASYCLVLKCFKRTYRGLGMISAQAEGGR
jgi:hypothetical protein